TLDVEVTLPAAAAGATVCAPALGNRRGEAMEWGGAWADGEPAAIIWQRDGCFVLPDEVEQFRATYRLRMRAGAYPAWRAMSLSPVTRASLMVFPGESVFIEVADDNEPVAWLPTRVHVRSSQRPFATLSASTTLHQADDTWLLEVEAN